MKLESMKYLEIQSKLKLKTRNSRIVIMPHWSIAVPGVHNFNGRWRHVELIVIRFHPKRQLSCSVKSREIHDSCSRFTATWDMGRVASAFSKPSEILAPNTLHTFMLDLLVPAALPHFLSSDSAVSMSYSVQGIFGHWELRAEFTGLSETLRRILDTKYIHVHSVP